jgi:hypothetical protein
MLVLDENLPAAQRQLLRKWRIRFRFVGLDVSSSGAGDEDLLPLLHALPHPTFCTLDRHFYRRDWVHPNYCLVWLDVRPREAAEFIRRFLRHAAFDTQLKRMDTVARVHANGVTCWHGRERSSRTLSWHAK